MNCSAIPDALFESEMFGYEKGAFTGAENNKKGKFELAHEGTIFLDEIVELTLQNQSKILRAVENKEISPVGSTRVIKLDVRELKNIIYRAFLSCENTTITKQDLESIFKNEFLKTDGDDIFQNTILFNSFKEMVEARYLETQLQKHEYSLKMTAQSLGMQTSNLSSKLKGFGIAVRR